MIRPNVDLYRKRGLFVVNPLSTRILRVRFKNN